MSLDLAGALKRREKAYEATQALGKRGEKLLLKPQSSRLWGIILHFVEDDKEGGAPSRGALWGRGRALLSLLLLSGKIPDLSGVFLHWWEEVVSSYLFFLEEGKYPTSPVQKKMGRESSSQLLANALWAAARQVLGGKGFTPLISPPISSIEDVAASLLLVLKKWDEKKPSEVIEGNLLEKVAEGVFILHSKEKLPLPRLSKKG